MKKIFLITFLIIASFVILPLKDYALDEVGEELKVYIGEVKVLSVSTPTRIVIGNPEIVDVTNVTKSEVTLSPKAQGITTLVVWDNFGEHSYRVNVLAERMQDVKRRVDNLLEKLNLPGVYTQAVDEEGKVLLLGEVKTSPDRERISTVLGPLKDKTVDLILVKEEEAVVDIDVEVLELSKDATNTLGFTWPITSTIDFTEKGSPGIATAGTKWSTLFKVLNIQRDAFSWTLDALVQEGKARILSRPRLACQSGKEAELMVGGEKPTFATYTTEGGTTGANIEYKEYGIKLKIKPTVTEEKRIKVALNVEVSEVGSVATFGTVGQAYPLKKRNASTEVFLNDGQTLAIGGLIKQKFEEDIEKTPGLGDIPILGIFFRKKTTTIGGGKGERGDTELFITLTPTIVSKKEEVAGEKKKEIKSALVAPTVSATPSVSEVPPPVASPVAPPIKEVTPKSAPLQNYISIVQRRILDNLSYPDSAKEAGFQGVVKLGLRISYSGELLDVSVKSSSGYSILDDNAVSVARGISPYPPFPPSIDQKEISIEIPIVYRLD